MTESMSTGATSESGYAGEDFVCRTCGCEVMVKHWGEPRSHADSGTFACHCGQQMEPEHPGQRGPARQGEVFNQEDFLGHGGGAGEASGVGRTSASSSSPGGGL